VGDLRRALTCLGDRTGLGGTEKALGPDQTEYQYGGTCLSLMFSYFGFLGAPLLVKISYFHPCYSWLSRGPSLNGRG
jgi:hypothetical protein